MFERLRFMTEFAGAYRRTRRDGAAHTDALDAATREVLDRRLGPDLTSALPDGVAEMWTDPEPTCGLADGAWFGDGSFDVTRRHIDLMRRMRFDWDSTESGAPMLDPRQPYGRGDLLTQLRETFGAESDADLARRHVEMLFVLARALRHGELTAGRYPEGTVEEDRLRLLRAIVIRWPSRYDCEDRLAAGRYPAATADPKRPYGDFTHIEVDMASVLDVLPPAPEDGIFRPDPELAARLARLHREMLTAVQLFVAHCELTPGAYRLD